jgi:hypothetical protein
MLNNHSQFNRNAKCYALSFWKPNRIANMNDAVVTIEEMSKEIVMQKKKIAKLEAKVKLQKKQNEKIVQLQKQLALIRSVFKMIGMYV